MCAVFGTDRATMQISYYDQEDRTRQFCTKNWAYSQNASWWWIEWLFETCRGIYQNKIKKCISLILLYILSRCTVTIILKKWTIFFFLAAVTHKWADRFIGLGLYLWYGQRCFQTLWSHRRSLRNKNWKLFPERLNWPELQLTAYLHLVSMLSADVHHTLQVSTTVVLVETTQSAVPYCMVLIQR